MDGFKSALERPRQFDDQKGRGNLTGMTDGTIETPVGQVPVLKTHYGIREQLGRVRVRLGIARDRYCIPPGLYAVGRPYSDSPIVVSCNYKLTIDLLRRDLAGHSVWLMLLNTDGINVWCAAGKGTFCTAEVLYWLELLQLKKYLKQRVLMIPQLGAPGIEPHLIRRFSGFKVSYGPVRSEDLASCLLSAETLPESARQVRFNTADRFEVAVLEVARHLTLSLGFMVAGTLLPSISVLQSIGWTGVAATIAGSLLVPLLLPVLPLRGFALNGILAYLPLAMLMVILGIPVWAVVAGVSYAAWQALNFTGSTTLTSYTMVKAEIKGIRPVMVVPVLLGAILLTLSILPR